MFISTLEFKKGRTISEPRSSDPTLLGVTLGRGCRQAEAVESDLEAAGPELGLREGCRLVLAHEGGRDEAGSGSAQRAPKPAAAT